MVNPILKETKYLLNYLLIWALITVAHITVLHVFYDTSTLISVIDGLIYNVLFCGLGLIYWFPVKFSNIESQNFITILINHFAAALISVGLWVFLGEYLLIAMFSKNESYIAFLDASIPWRYISGMLYYSLIVFFYYMMLYYKNLQQRIAQEASLKALVHQAELNILKAQISPHFLFNGLNSISSLTITEPEKAQEMIIKLSEFLRYSVNKDGNQKTSFDNELLNIDRYLDIEKIRFGDRLHYDKQTSYECLKMKIPNLILQPLFENVIKHGVHESLVEILIRLTSYCENNMLYISITNNYDPESVMKSKSGIGLKNIKERLQLIYHRNDLVSILKNDKEFTVKLTIPQ